MDLEIHQFNHFNENSMLTGNVIRVITAQCLEVISDIVRMESFASFDMVVMELLSRYQITNFLELKVGLPMNVPLLAWLSNISTKVTNFLNVYIMMNSVIVLNDLENEIIHMLKTFNLFAPANIYNNDLSYSDPNALDIDDIVDELKVSELCSSFIDIGIGPLCRHPVIISYFQWSVNECCFDNWICKSDLYYQLVLFLENYSTRAENIVHNNSSSKHAHCPKDISIVEFKRYLCEYYEVNSIYALGIALVDVNFNYLCNHVSMCDDRIYSSNISSGSNSKNNSNNNNSNNISCGVLFAEELQLIKHGILANKQYAVTYMKQLLDLHGIGSEVDPLHGSGNRNKRKRRVELSVSNDNTVVNDVTNNAVNTTSPQEPTGDGKNAYQEGTHTRPVLVDIKQMPVSKHYNNNQRRELSPHYSIIPCTELIGCYPHIPTPGATITATPGGPATSSNTNTNNICGRYGEQLVYQYLVHKYIQLSTSINTTTTIATATATPTTISNKIQTINSHEPADKVTFKSIVWCNQESECHSPYDIRLEVLVSPPTGPSYVRTHYIEVKSTVFGDKHQFELSLQELEFMWSMNKRSDGGGISAYTSANTSILCSYDVYRVYNVPVGTSTTVDNVYIVCLENIMKLLQAKHASIHMSYCV